MNKEDSDLVRASLMVGMLIEDKVKLPANAISQSINKAFNSLRADDINKYHELMQILDKHGVSFK